jgi:hypothetical protein
VSLDASTIISLIAVLASLLFGLYNARAVRHERQDRKRELSLYEQELDAPRRADLVLGGNRSPSGTYNLTLRNLGLSWAKDIGCTVQAETRAQEFPSFTMSRFEYLARGEHTSLPFDSSDGVSSSKILLRVAWTDRAGSHRQESRYCVTPMGLFRL